MGGIGTEDMIIKYNAYAGTEGKIFAAGLALAGADNGQVYPEPNAPVVAALKNVPFRAIHGGQDAVNGTVDATPPNVTELAYVNGTVWQENAGSLW
jgi:hypothetical protein